MLILLVSAVLISACDDGGEEDPDLVSIEYTLGAQEEGSFADIEYTSGFGNIILEDVPLPWSIDFDAIFRNGDALSLKAESGAAGALNAQIIVDDEVVASDTASHLVQISYIKGLK